MHFLSVPNVEPVSAYIGPGDGVLRFCTAWYSKDHLYHGNILARCAEGLVTVPYVGPVSAYVGPGDGVLMFCAA